MQNNETPPSLKDLTLRTFAMPSDANPIGDIFGGWLVSLMDMAGVAVPMQHTQERVVTISIDKMSFLRPVFVGDEVSCYTHHVKTGTTSMQVHVEAWARNPRTGSEHKVTDGLFTYVAIGEDRKPIPFHKG